jgi:hypothetical protein
MKYLHNSVIAFIVPQHTSHPADIRAADGVRARFEICRRSTYEYLLFHMCVVFFVNPGWESQYESRDKATGWTTGIRFPAGAMMGFLLFATATRPALGPTQPLIQWVPGACHRAGKGAGAWHWSFVSSAEVKNAWSCTSIPQYVFTARCLSKQGTRLHGVCLCTGTSLPLPLRCIFSVLDFLYRNAWAYFLRRGCMY